MFRAFFDKLYSLRFKPIIKRQISNEEINISNHLNTYIFQISLNWKVHTQVYSPDDD